MSEKINWIPDENGVPKCGVQIGLRCPRGEACPEECNMGDDDGMCFDGCYPQMVKIVAVLNKVAARPNSMGASGMETLHDEVIEALTP